MKILNLYAGIGGNRKLWEGHEITSVENDPRIAEIYKGFFPSDTVIVTDAHDYLVNHFMEYDFIWSSPPCPSHSKIRNEAGVGSGQNKPIYPDMKLYEEIILMQQVSELGLYKGKYVIENVVSYYSPLITPQEIGLHYFWSNFFIRPKEITTRNHFSGVDALQRAKGFDLSSCSKVDKVKILRNCTEPETGLHILNEAFKSDVQSLF